jgi:tetratricopeptide (TPR) repeat protein
MTLIQSRILFLTVIGILIVALADPLAAEDTTSSDKARFEWPAPRQRPHVVVASLLKAKASALTPFSVEIVPPDNLPATSLIRIQGLPASVTLSAGQAIAAGTWAVPMLSLDNLNINVPASVAGKSELIISLIARDGTVLAEQKSALVIEPANVVASPSGMPVAMPTERVTTTPVSPAPSTTNAPPFATTVENQAELPKDANLLAETERLYRRALAVDEKSLGPDHILVANRVLDLAVLLHKTNRLAEAEPLYRRALEINEKNLGSEHPMVAVVLNNLAVLLLARNRFAEAEPLMRRALAIDEKNLGPDDRTVAVRLNNLALLLQSTRRLVEAELFYRRALAIDEKNFGPNHPNVGIALTNLALLLKATNRPAEAESFIRRASTLRQKNDDHPNLSPERRQDETPPTPVNRSPEPGRAQPPIARSAESTQADRAVEVANAPGSAPVAAVPAVPVEKKSGKRPVESVVSSAAPVVRGPELPDVSVTSPQNESEDRPTERTENWADTAVVQASVAADLPGAAEQKAIEDRPAERAASSVDAVAQAATTAFLASPQKSVEERPAERTVGPGGTAVVRAPVTAEITVASPQKSAEERPTERAAEAVVVPTPVAAAVTAASPQKSVEEHPAERSESPAELAVARPAVGADVSVASPEKSAEGRPGERAAGPAEAVVVRPPVAPDVPVAGSQKNAEGRPGERAAGPTATLVVRPAVAPDVPVAGPQKNAEGSPAERSPSRAEAAVVQAAAEVSLASPQKITDDRPAERGAGSGSAAIVQVPVAADARAATPQRRGEDQPAERAATSADAVVVRAPVVAKVRVASPVKKTEDRPAELASGPALAVVAHPPAAVASGEKDTEGRSTKRAVTPPEATMVPAPVIDVPVAPPHKNFEDQQAEEDAGAPARVVIAAPKLVTEERATEHTIIPAVPTLGQVPVVADHSVGGPQNKQSTKQNIIASPIAPGPGLTREKPQEAPVGRVAALPTVPAPVIVRPAPTPAQQAQSMRLLTLGERYLGQGNIAVARQYFIRAADAGIASAALKIGETYDPRELSRLNVVGLAPDIVEARRWYTRALQLGLPGAETKLRGLDGQ